MGFPMPMATSSRCGRRPSDGLDLRYLFDLVAGQVDYGHLFDAWSANMTRLVALAQHEPVRGPVVKNVIGRGDKLVKRHGLLPYFKRG